MRNRPIVSALVFIALLLTSCSAFQYAHAEPGTGAVTRTTSEEIIEIWFDDQANKTDILDSYGVTEIIYVANHLVYANATHAQFLAIQNAGYGVSNLTDRFHMSAAYYNWDTRYDEPDIPSEYKIDHYPSNFDGIYFIQFIVPPLPEWMSSLESIGVQPIGEYWNPYTRFVCFNSNIESAVREKWFVQWVGIDQPAYKLLNTPVRTGNISINLCSDDNLNNTLDSLKSIDPNCRIIDDPRIDGCSVEMNIKNTTVVSYIAKLPYVYSITFASGGNNNAALSNENLVAKYYYMPVIAGVILALMVIYYIKKKKDVKS